jgi:uncharacterized protein with PIN domain
MALLLQSEGVEANARELTRRISIDWLSCAFTRCMIDNATLRAVRDEETRRIPASAREHPGPLRVCPLCKRIFWPGSHVRRMKDRLAEWHAEQAGQG